MALLRGVWAMLLGACYGSAAVAKAFIAASPTATAALMPSTRDTAVPRRKRIASCRMDSRPETLAALASLCRSAGTPRGESPTPDRSCGHRTKDRARDGSGDHTKCDARVRRFRSAFFLAASEGDDAGLGRAKDSFDRWAGPKSWEAIHIPESALLTTKRHSPSRFAASMHWQAMILGGASTSGGRAAPMRAHARVRAQWEGARRGGPSLVLPVSSSQIFPRRTEGRGTARVQQLREKRPMGTPTHLLSAWGSFFSCCRTFYASATHTIL